MSKNKIIDIILFLCVVIAFITKILGFTLFSRIICGAMSVLFIYNIIFCFDNAAKRGVLIYLSIILIPLLFLVYCLIFEINNIALLRLSGYIFILVTFIGIGISIYYGRKNRQYIDKYKKLFYNEFRQYID